jgi:hypothetical protein
VEVGSLLVERLHVGGADPLHVARTVSTVAAVARSHYLGWALPVHTTQGGIRYVAYYDQGASDYRSHEFYRPFQRMLLRALYERPAAGPSGVTHSLSGVELPFCADLFELVCERLDRCCFTAPTDLPTFAWHVHEEMQPATS